MSITDTADLLIEPRWLLPVAPANAVLEGQAVAVSDGRIVAVGPAAELRQRYRARSRIVRERHALLPGLVNAHTLACHTLLRGVPMRSPRVRWVLETLAPLERRALSADLVRDGTRLAIAEMLCAGITCYADQSPVPDEAARVAAAAQVRALIGLPIAEVATVWAEDITAHLAKAESLWDEYRSDARIGLYFAPQAAHGLSDGSLLRVRRVADELDARIVIHLAELPEQAAAPQAALQELASEGAMAVADGAAAPRHSWGTRRLAHLKALGLLRPGFSAIGALGCSDEDAQQLARHGAVLIACPQAELRLQSGKLAPPRSRPAALGTDTAAAGALDLLGEARTAALLFGLTALETLRLATLGGATALGLAAEIGSIEPGKSADLTCIDLDSPGCRPHADVAAAIVFGATRSQVTDVWSAGRAAVSEGRLRLFDEEELAALAGQWAQRLTLEVAA